MSAWEEGEQGNGGTLGRRTLLHIAAICREIERLDAERLGVQYVWEGRGAVGLNVDAEET